VLFPAYLAAAVRNRRWRLVPITFVFATGLAVVLVPITLGVGVLTESLLRFHSAVYALGGILMLGLAAVVVFGLHWSLPMFKNGELALVRHYVEMFVPSEQFFAEMPG
jgi:cytochrome c biogenesis protein CcdA